MIIDPQSFIPLEMDRHLAAARAAQFAREHRSPRRSGPRRGLRLRLAAWITGRAIHA
ncbi:hypothetical protein [Aeromicrobium sp. UC242_57]|uniref:hypothetical protein n=1 Tax=Aeromicrobium sp. UC242_57 TaxID=3374624 RepID=UPI00378DF269